MVNLFKIVGYNLTYSGPNVITATPYEINSSISQYEEVILEATVDKVSLPGPVTVSVFMTLPNGNEYDNVYMLGSVDQPNKFRLRLNDVIGNDLVVGETNTLTVTFRVRTETDVFITTTDISFDLYKTNLDISYHPTDIDSLFIGLNKLSMNIADVDSTVQNYVDIANQYTDERVSELEEIIEGKVDSLNIYTKNEVDSKFETKADHESGLTNLRAQIEQRYETKTDANNKLEEAKKYADELLGKLGGETGSIEGDAILSQAKLYTDNQISELVGAAPDELNTLKELADALNENETIFEALETTVGNKANSADVYTKTESDNLYVTKEAGKGLSTNDYTTAEKSKLSSLVNYDDTAVRDRISALESKDTVSHSEVYTKSEADTTFATKNDLTTTNNKFGNYYTKTETSTLLNQKQERLVSGTNVKTINGVSILGTGNIVVESGGSVDLTGYATEDYVEKKIEELTELDADTIQSIRELSEELSTNQEAVDALNNAIALKANKDEVYTKSETNSLLGTKADSSNVYTKVETSELLAAKQNVLVSGQSIKTINGESILGEGNIDSVNETRVNELIDNKIDTNNGNYYTKAEVDEKYFEKSEISQYAKTSYVDDAITNLLGTAPEELDTLQELASAIKDNDVDIAGLNTLVANTYTKTEVDNLIESIDVTEQLENYYTKAEVDDAIAAADISDKLNDYYTKTEVDDAIASIDVTEQLADYETKTDASSKLVEAKNYSNSNLATAKTYSDANLGTAKKYSDSNLSAAKTYADSVGSSTLTSAKNYSNSNLSSAKSYTDSKVSGILSDAKSYSDTNLRNARSYTDTEIDKVEKTITDLIGGAPAAYDTLKEIAEYIDSDKTGASNMLASINTNASDIDALETRSATIEGNIEKKVLFKNWAV